MPGEVHVVPSSRAGRAIGQGFGVMGCQVGQALQDAALMQSHLQGLAGRGAVLRVCGTCGRHVHVSKSVFPFFLKGCVDFWNVWKIVDVCLSDTGCLGSRLHDGCSVKRRKG